VRQEQEPASTEVAEVAPGVLRLQLPIALPGLGHVNCYALEDERGLVLVDPGLPGPRSWRALVDRLALLGRKVADVRTVVATHSHPDHYGGARRLRREAGAAIVTHEAFRDWWSPGGPDATTPWGGERWRPPLRMRVLTTVGRRVAREWFLPPTPTERVEDAQPLRLGGRDWVAVHTPGHTPDHLCLFDPDAGTLLSGDHVLPSITPHISGLGGDDPLAGFLTSLDRVRALDGVATVLPAHGHPSTDLAARVDAIAAHHRERLDAFAAAVAAEGPAGVPALTRAVFPERSWGPMADSETYAHLEHLCHEGRIRRDPSGPTLRYAPT
jgi:glyoxylase-like metal-dependent hydrolase (beta-lactamase superfamily II)